MKKMSVVTLLIVPFLLCSCSQEKTGIEKPSFSSYKNLVSYGEFVEKYNSLFETFGVSPLLENENSKSFSFAGKRVLNKTDSTTLSGKGKEVVAEHVITDLNTNVSGSYDQTNSLFDYSGNQKDVVNHKFINNEQSYEIASDVSRNFQLQKMENEDKEVMVSIFNRNTKALTITDSEEAKFNSEGATIALATLFYSDTNIPSAEVWDAYSEANQSKYKFYIDGSTITMSFQDNVDVEGKTTTPTGEDVTVTYTKKKISLLLQFAFSNNDLKYHEYYTLDSSVKTISYLENYTSTELVESKSISAIDSAITLDDAVSLIAESPSGYYEGNDYIKNLYFK